MAFNPDNFRFERIVPKEEKKPLIEWDALHRFVVIRVVEGDEITYQTSPLSSTVNENLLNNLPDEYSYENDKLVTFSVYEDGSYLMEKQKLKYNFQSKDSRWIRYQYTDLTEVQARQIFEVIRAAIEVANLEKTIAKTTAITDLATRQSFLEQLDEERQENYKLIMRATEWSQLADATDSFPNEIALWTQYRAYLRDNVRTVDEFTDPLDFITHEDEWRWPIDPKEYVDNDPNQETPYLSVPEHFKTSVYRTGVRAVEAIEGPLQQAAQNSKAIARDGDGVPVSKRIWEIAQQYNLIDGLDGLTDENVKLMEDS